MQLAQTPPLRLPTEEPGEVLIREKLGAKKRAKIRDGKGNGNRRLRGGHEEKGSDPCAGLFYLQIIERAARKTRGRPVRGGWQGGGLWWPRNEVRNGAGKSY